jgi:hypothetical protein
MCGGGESCPLKTGPERVLDHALTDKLQLYFAELK